MDSLVSTFSGSESSRYAYLQAATWTLPWLPAEQRVCCGDHQEVFACWKNCSATFSFPHLQNEVLLCADKSCVRTTYGDDTIFLPYPRLAIIRWTWNMHVDLHSEPKRLHCDTTRYKCSRLGQKKNCPMTACSAWYFHFLSLRVLFVFKKKRWRYLV